MKADSAAPGAEPVARLRRLADDVRRLTAGLDDAALDARTVPDKWSLKELVCHLWRVQGLFEARIDRMLAEDSPGFESYAPEGDPVFDALVGSHRGAEAVHAFLSDRDRFAHRLDRFSPAEWRRTGHHPTFATFDVAFLAEYMAHHEAHHVYQMFMRRIPFGRLPQ